MGKSSWVFVKGTSVMRTDLTYKVTSYLDHFIASCYYMNC